MVNTELFSAVVITSTAGSRTVTVIRETYINAKSDSGHMMQGVLVSPVMATFLGFKDSYVPQPGSRVLCLADAAGGSCFILGALPQPSLNLVDLPSRGALGQKHALADKANRMGHETDTPVVSDNRRAGDVVDGEFVVGNEFGVMIALYQQMAALKASELAQVQCFLLDDLVRIISHNFQHYSAIGEYNIYHDGKRLFAEFGATHRVPEIYGRPAVNSDSGAPVFSKEGSHTVDDATDFYKITKESVSKQSKGLK